MTKRRAMQRVTIYRVRGGARSVVFTGNVAKTWRERLRGLLGSAKLSSHEAMVIAPCSSVHTFGMTYPIDVAYLDANGRVIKCVEGVAPRRLSASWRSRSVVETAAGALRRVDVRAGDRLYWKESLDVRDTKG